MSQAQKEYFERLEVAAEECYQLAGRARTLGWDPARVVEMPRAADLADRVEELVGPKGISKIINELSVNGKSREAVAFEVACRLAREQLEEFGTEKALEQAVRTALAILTEGVLVAPTEGVTDVKLMQNLNGTQCVSLYYAGPIRSAGGTGQALSVLVADVVRRELGVDAYIPTSQEVERYKEEVALYNRKVNLQYAPSSAEVESIITACPICMTGESTEKGLEVSGHRDLARVGTNGIRGGAVLVLAEGLCQKAPKLLSHVDRMGISGWGFLRKYWEARQARERESGDENQDQKKGSPKYLRDVVAGRPVFAYPHEPGGFRLHYGRSRLMGLAACGMNPATLVVLDSFLALGTQLKMELPGKAASITPADDLEGPIVLCHNGDLRQINTLVEARKYKDQVARIIDLGEILISAGEFLENNRPLEPSGYDLKWWALEAGQAMGHAPFENEMRPDWDTALELSLDKGLPLHPHFNLFWHDLTPEEIVRLQELILTTGSWEIVANYLSVPDDDIIKDLLTRLGVLHLARERKLLVQHHGPALVRCLGLEVVKDGLKTRENVNPLSQKTADPLVLVSHLAGFSVRARSPTRIGGSMGRPEKAKERLLSPPPHALIPVGKAGGTQRLVKQAATFKEVWLEVGQRACPRCSGGCPECEGRLPQLRCHCGAPTHPVGGPEKTKVDMRAWIERASANVHLGVMANTKGVQGLISQTKTPESLEKGLLRSKHMLHVNKDGTCRFDMMNLPCTHFKPQEIGLSLEKARELGYTHDHMGQTLTDAEQLCELKVQDLILSRISGRFLVKVARFVDDELEYLYGEPRFYNLPEPGPQDQQQQEALKGLIGQMTIGLSPHTSGGVLSRLIGYTSAKACYAHPYFHAAKRRNCDGDEDSVQLLLDGLLNFSKSFIPDKRGGTMDIPLVLTTRLDPSEIDKEAHNVEVGGPYTLDFYEASLRRAPPEELSKMVETVKKRLGKANQFEGLAFNHEIHSLNIGPIESYYVTLGSMADKTRAQLELGRRIRAVNEGDVAQRLIQVHFLRDMIGNLRSFATQGVRCTKCGAKYRRVPLGGRCTSTKDRGDNSGKVCGQSLTLNIHPASVSKYLELTEWIIAHYDISPFVVQRVELSKQAIESTLNASPTTQQTLGDFI